jgi:hypothetical protein
MPVSKSVKIRLSVDCPKAGEIIPMEGNCVTFHPTAGRWRKGYLNLLDGESLYTCVTRCDYFRGLEFDRRHYPKGVKCAYKRQ